MSLWDTFKNTSGFNMLDSFMNPQRGYEDADKATRQYWDEAKRYMQPYNDAGVGEIGRLKDATGRLLDPEGLQNQWSQGYEESPYAKDAVMRSTNLGMDAASSMGLMGSSPAIESIQRTGSSIMNADRRNYLQDLMQKYLTGVQTSQNIFGTGASMGSTMGQGAMNTGQNVAQMRYGAANAPGEMFGNLMGTAAGAAAHMYGGG